MINNPSRNPLAKKLTERESTTQGNCEWCLLWDGSLIGGLCGQCRPKFEGNVTMGFNITPVERQIICGIADGKAYDAIASDRGCSPRTIEKHAERIKKKFGVSKLGHLVAECFRRGVITVNGVAPPQTPEGGGAGTHEITQGGG